MRASEGHSGSSASAEADSARTRAVAAGRSMVLRKRRQSNTAGLSPRQRAEGPMRNRTVWWAVLALVAGASGAAGRARAQEPPAAASREWWKGAVFYEIYPRSFAD